MAKIITTTRVEIQDVRGEKFILERQMVTSIGDNPLFFANSADSELEAARGTVKSQLEHHFGQHPGKP